MVLFSLLLVIPLGVNVPERVPQASLVHPFPALGVGAPFAQRHLSRGVSGRWCKWSDSFRWAWPGGEDGS